MMFYYRADMFTQSASRCPTTWDEYAETARALHAADPTKYLGTFSANDPGWFAGLAQQAGAKWWAIDGDAWRSASTTSRTQKVADYWGGLVAEGAIDNQPMYTPEWNAGAQQRHADRLARRRLGPGRARRATPPTPRASGGRAAAAVDARASANGNWGGSSTAVTTQSKHTRGGRRVRDLAEHRPGGRHRARRGDAASTRRRRRRGQRPSPTPPGVLRQPARLLHDGRRGREGRRAVHLRPERQRRVQRLQGRVRQGRRGEDRRRVPRGGHCDAGDHGRRPEASGFTVAE